MAEVRGEHCFLYCGCPRTGVPEPYRIIECHAEHSVGSLHFHGMPEKYPRRNFGERPDPIGFHGNTGATDRGGLTHPNISIIRVYNYEYNNTKIYQYLYILYL